MARYIDADVAIERIENDCLEQYYSKQDAIDCINCMPSADVVKVVRCKECKYQDECLQKVDCEYLNREIFYCSYGERKDKK